MQINTIRYRFIHERLLKFGQALYISGNIPQLGCWNPDFAIRLECYKQKYWIGDIDIPIDMEIQYKYFISSFDHHYEKGKIFIKNKNWIGNPNDNCFNFKLFLMIRDSKYISASQIKKQFKIMSFNLRCETKYDPNEYHWSNRKENCLQIIKQNYPSILGVQQARQTQRKYLQYNLSHLYNYVGISRDYSLNGQQVGIFYDKQKFISIQHGFRWISQTGQRGSLGYGASYSRYFTYIILEDTYVSQNYRKHSSNSYKYSKQSDQQRFIMIVNVHLDHLSGLAQQKGVQMMINEFYNKKVQYKNQIKDFFMFGDFNCQQKNNIFDKISLGEIKFISIRKYLANKKKQYDNECTFNNFNHNTYDYGKKTIDHLFISTQSYQPQKFEVIRKLEYQNINPKNNIISDHYPIVGLFNPLNIK